MTHTPPTLSLPALGFTHVCFCTQAHRHGAWWGNWRVTEKAWSTPPSSQGASRQRRSTSAVLPGGPELDLVACSQDFHRCTRLPGTLGSLERTAIIHNHRNCYYCYSNALSLLPLLGRKLLDAWYLEQKGIYHDKVFL